ncbi:MAG: transporter substrate-binding domain-containing protein [Burkholderiales bacterium]|nr:transporter substrate-binding domain-containing protein [Burkholderiales bacterium]
MIRTIWRIALLCLPLWVAARDIKVAVGLSLPPYVLETSNAGMELDVVSTALADTGNHLNPVYLPFARVPLAIERGEVDAAITVNEASGIKAAFSDSHIVYQNFAISLHKNAFHIHSVNDLAGRSIAAFQNAKRYLGGAFSAMADANPAYEEYAQQVKQNMLLYSGHVDVVVADRNIFRYFNAEAGKRGIDVNQAIDYHEIFPPTYYKVAFRDPTLRDAFNAALKKMRADGRYEAIMKKYQ